MLQQFSSRICSPIFSYIYNGLYTLAPTICLKKWEFSVLLCILYIIYTNSNKLPQNVVVHYYPIYILWILLTLWLPRTFLYCFKCIALRLMFYIILYNKINLMATWSTGHPGS